MMTETSTDPLRPVARAARKCRDCGQLTGSTRYARCRACGERHRLARAYRGKPSPPPSPTPQTPGRYTLACCRCETTIHLNSPKPRVPLCEACREQPGRIPRPRPMEVTQ